MLVLIPYKDKMDLIHRAMVDLVIALCGLLIDRKRLSWFLRKLIVLFT